MKYLVTMFLMVAVVSLSACMGVSTYLPISRSSIHEASNLNVNETLEWLVPLLASHPSEHDDYTPFLVDKKGMALQNLGIGFGELFSKTKRKAFFEFKELTVHCIIYEKTIDVVALPPPSPKGIYFYVRHFSFSKQEEGDAIKACYGLLAVGAKYLKQYTEFLLLQDSTSKDRL